jgi:hypothetical protein
MSLASPVKVCWSVQDTPPPYRASHIINHNAIRSHAKFLTRYLPYPVYPTVVPSVRYTSSTLSYL